MKPNNKCLPANLTESTYKIRFYVVRTSPDIQLLITGPWATKMQENLCVKASSAVQLAKNASYLNDLPACPALPQAGLIGSL